MVVIETEITIIALGKQIEQPNGRNDVLYLWGGGGTVYTEVLKTSELAHKGSTPFRLTNAVELIYPMCRARRHTLMKGLNKSVLK